MFPWKSIIDISATCPLPVYVQIANDIAGEIKQGRAPAGSRLPGTRAMSEAIGVHRKTVVAAYEELEAQGWIEIHPSKGAFVHNTLPLRRPLELNKPFRSNVEKSAGTGFAVKHYNNLHTPVYAPPNMLGLHDGPDVRLVPSALVARTYKSVLARKTITPYLRYNPVEGNHNFRRVLSNYLNESRGLQTSPEQVFITRGSQMGMFLIAMSLLEKGDVVLAGNPGYYYAERTFTNFGAAIERVPVDEHGLVTEAIEEVCRRKKVRMIYVTPHHHYPTSVTLCAPRRMELLALAEQYGFAILEDDYDYDFHYQSSPLLPLASADRHNMVVYIGSLSKTFAPALRVGFIVAPQNLLNEIGKRRHIIDVQSDWLLEQTMADLFKLGEIQRHMKKALKIYRHRCNVFCEMLTTELGHVLEFKKPEGGMAVWAKFDQKIDVIELAKKTKNHGLAIPSGSIIDKASDRKWNSTRLGFASVNESEMEQAVGVLKKLV
ncbi:MAG: PLP-dependent aminotransferase family protein [Bacteroidota bacterium]